MKRILSLLLVTAMLFVCTACGGNAEPNTPEEPDASSEKKVFANLALDLSDEFHANIDNTFRTLFDGTDVEVMTSDCGQDTQLQLEQLESYIAMDVDYIFIASLDLMAMRDALIEAMEQGIQVYIYGSDPGDSEMYDVLFAADEFELGDQCARAAAKWVDETFADAADDSVEVVAFDVSALKALSVYQRVVGLMNFEEYSAKGKVVNVLDPGTDITPVKFQELINSSMISYPNAQVFLTWSSALASVVNESLLMTPGLDYDKMWIGTTDWNSLLGDMLKENQSGAANNPFRCAIGFENPAYAVYDVVMGEMEVPENKWVALDIFAVSVDNLDEYYGKY